METLYLLIPLSVVLVFLIIAVLWWAVRAGQFDDMQGPAASIILDDDQVSATSGAPSAPKDPKKP